VGYNFGAGKISYACIPMHNMMVDLLVRDDEQQDGSLNSTINTVLG
jgi:hypothetical protein